jgi:hypothetical protein
LHSRIIRLATAAVFAVALTCSVAAPKAHADDGRAHCQRAIEKAESRLDHAIARNGEHSREAEDRRRDLNAQRQRCWEQYHGWWNGHDRRWETEQNWDRDDHHDDHH